MTLVYQGAFRLHQVPMGPYDNNGYVIADAQGQECYLVDTPPEPEKLLNEAKGMRVRGILITHNHQDHLMGFHQIRQATEAPVGIHDADKDKLPVSPDFLLTDGMELALAEATIRVLHTPGHTPGSVCLLVGKHLLSGDTLFPGGPGKTGSPANLKQIVESITQKVLPLDDDVTVNPGHGDNTTIGQAREDYQVFASRSHPDDLCGDVLWLTS